VNCPGEVSLATTGILTEEDFCPPCSTSPSLKVTAHLLQARFRMDFIPMSAIDNQVTTPEPFNYKVCLVRLEGFEPPTLGSVV
jgi:hypothetical protein